ncbi:MAG: HIT family protein [Nitrosopumilaceae archaeon]|nr:HIT family protein [Nitrosopumilaceae archaeon]
MDCIFCAIINNKLDSHLIYEDEHHIAFLDKYPVDTGHSLVVPRKHYEKIIDMQEYEVGDLFSKVPKIAKAILNTTSANAFSLGQNNGKAAKQVIPHVHVHIIPRYNEKNTVWTKRNIGNEYELNKLAQKIRKVV